MRRLFFCLMVVCAAPAMAQAQKVEASAPQESGKLDVAVKRVEVDSLHMYEVNSSGTVRTAPASVWKILTNYDRMSEFVPDLASCRVLSRNGNEVIVEQFGTARFLFMSKSIHLVVRATETPMSAIDIALVSGDMKHYESRWELVPVPETGGTRIVYSGRLIPDFYVPGVLGAQMIRADIKRMMAAVMARLDGKPEP